MKFWPFRCSRWNHRAPYVEALSAEIRGDPHLNNLRPYVRFYLKCKGCGATADVLRETGKVWLTAYDLIVNVAIWEEPDD